MSASSREYDPEIKDIADYVANKAIDSELAVSFCADAGGVPLIFQTTKIKHTPPSPPGREEANRMNSIQFNSSDLE